MAQASSVLHKLHLTCQFQARFLPFLELYSYQEKDKEARVSKRKLVVAPALTQGSTFSCNVQHFSCISQSLRTSDTLFSAVSAQQFCWFCSLLLPSKENSSFSVRTPFLLRSQQRRSECSAVSLKHPTEKCFRPRFSLPSGCCGPFTRYRDLLGPGFTLVGG